MHGEIEIQILEAAQKDVESILRKFNDQRVDAVLIDLRGNSGGSLFEANKLTGLFVSSGAILQVKESDGSVRPWGDFRAKLIWKKPMAVMVDRYSASASEILQELFKIIKRDNNWAKNIWKRYCSKIR